MLTLGEQLTAARKAKAVSREEAGESIRTLTRIIENMENDDFSEMAAPTYAKGFIRLYAKYLGLDPEPLVEEYIRKNPAEPRSLMGDPSKVRKKAPAPAPKPVKEKVKRPVKAPRDPSAKKESVFADFMIGMGAMWSKRPNVRSKHIRIVGGSIAAVVILVVLSMSVTTCVRERAANRPAALPVERTEAARMLLDEELPDLYLVEPGKVESSL